MTRLAKLALATGFLTATMIAQANAWTRETHHYGWRGHSSTTASGSCNNGSCSRQVQRTGPYGNTVSRSGSASCGGGRCDATRTTTGPRGGSVTRDVTISR